MHDAAVLMVQKFLPNFPKYTRGAVQANMVSHAGADQIKCDHLAPTIEHPEARYIETNSGGAYERIVYSYPCLFWESYLFRINSIQHTEH